MAHADQEQTPALQRHFGLLHATALNVSMIVGAGVFITIPYMLLKLPGPYALLGWLAAGALMLVDGLVWSELGAALPGSGGSYLYLLESYGRDRWGRLMAFLFIWQFLISGPLEVASGLIASSGGAAGWPDDFWTGLGGAMILAMYSYLGYYNVCYIGDEVRNPGRTIP